MKSGALLSHGERTASAGTKAPGTKMQIYGLDLLRFLAALVVMFFHLGFWYWAGEDKHEASYHFLAPLTFFGFVGVEVFFTLSGFIIAYSAESVTALNFAKGRVVRLYPAAWICSTLTLAVCLAAHVHDPRSSVFESTAAVLRAYGRAFVLSPVGPWLDGVYWTLGVELAFYVVICWLLAAGWFHRVGAVMAALGFLSTAGWIVVGFAHYRPASAGTFILPISRFMLGSPFAQLGLLDHGCFFAIGVLLWLCLFRRTTPGRLLAVLICAIGSLLEIRVHVQLLHLGRSGLHLALPTLIWLVFVLMIIGSVVMRDPIKELLGTAGASAAKTLGLMTYPLYLLHENIGFVTLSKLHNHIPDLLSLGIAILLMLTLSFCVNRFLEKPLQIRVRGWLHVGRTSPGAASTLP